MSKKNHYTNEPLDDLKVIPDFLPSPEELVLKGDNIKVTLSLSKQSIDFFKQEAKANNTQYQKMIRILLDKYASHYRDSDK